MTDYEHMQTVSAETLPPRSRGKSIEVYADVLATIRAAKIGEAVVVKKQPHYQRQWSVSIQSAFSKKYDILDFRISQRKIAPNTVAFIKLPTNKATP